MGAGAPQRSWNNRDNFGVFGLAKAQLCGTDVLENILPLLDQQGFAQHLDDEAD